MKNFSIRLDDDTKKKVVALADTTGLSEADIIRMCVGNALPAVEAKFKADKKANKKSDA